MSGSACLCVPVPTCVYGPPPNDATNTASESAETTPEEEFLPEENIGECVYGPPEWFGIEEETSAEETEIPTETEESQEEAVPAETTTESETSPSADENALPPESESETEPQTEDSEIEFDPEENIEVAVYGPPEWFE